MPVQWWDKDPSSEAYKAGAAKAALNATGRLTPEESQNALGIINAVQQAQSGSKTPGAYDAPLTDPMTAIQAKVQFDAQRAAVATLTPEEKVARAKKVAAVQAKKLAEAQQVMDAGGMVNGIPVKIENGVLRYDLDKIGAEMGLTPDQISQAANTNFGERSIGTGNALSDLVSTGGQGIRGGQERQREDAWTAAASSLSEEQAFINNLAQLDPTTAQVDFNNEDHLTNLAKPGYMSDSRGDARERLDAGQDPGGIGKYARYAVPALAGLTIGAGILGAAGAFGAGSTVLGSGAAAPGLASGIGPAGAGAGLGSTAGGFPAAGAVAAGAGTAAAGAGTAIATGGAGAGTAALATGAGAVASGIPWEEIATVGGAVAGGVIAYQGAGDAADAIEDAADRAAEVQWQMYQQGREDLAPWREAGEAALTELSAKVAAGPGEFEESPGYQFTLQEGLNAQQNALSAMGLNRSGKHIKAATQYAEGLASTEYDNFLKRWYQSLNPLQSLAGVGQTSAGQTAILGQNAAGNIGNFSLTGGQANAAGSIGQANALTGAITGGANQLLYLNSLRNLQPAQGYQTGAPNTTGAAVDQWQYNPGINVKSTEPNLFYTH